MTEIKIKVKHRNTVVEASIPKSEYTDIHASGELAKWIDARLKSIVDQIKRLQETP